MRGACHQGALSCSGGGDRGEGTTGNKECHQQCATERQERNKHKGAEQVLALGITYIKSASHLHIAEHLPVRVLRVPDWRRDDTELGAANQHGLRRGSCGRCINQRKNGKFGAAPC